jgi:predicted O-methyltransferase YrrM
MKKNLTELLLWIIPYRICIVIQQVLISRRFEKTERKGISAQCLKYSYEGAIKTLIDDGLDEAEVRKGSIPEASLVCVSLYLSQQLPKHHTAPTIGLHIGNFVGISLSFLANAMAELSARARIICIDPDIEHRGIHNPHQHVVKLLRKYGLLDVCLFVSGYSMAPPAFPENGFHTLTNLGLIARESIDFAIIDGNHDIHYLQTEVEVTIQLLKPGGSIIFDDVNAAYVEIWSYIQKLKSDPTLEFMLQDGRIACFRKRDFGGH